MFIAIFSYLSIEVITIPAEKASDPEMAVPRALRKTVFR